MEYLVEKNIPERRNNFSCGNFYPELTSRIMLLMVL